MASTHQTLKIPFAVRNGRTVHVSEVSSGIQKDCLCAECQQPLIAKKGAINTHHFAHDGDHSCAGETILHLLAKNLMKERLDSGIQTKTPVPMVWHCGMCGGTHRGDLLKRARSVRVEKGLAGKVPDLTLLDQSGNPCGVVEIVVTHRPEAGALATYTDLKISAVEIHVSSVSDLIGLHTSHELKPFAVTFCPVPAWQRREVILGRTPVKLWMITMEVRGCVLSILDTDSQGVGEGAIRGAFVFSKAVDAQLALDALKTGKIDGLGDPDSIMSQVECFIRNRDLVRRLAASILEYSIEWVGWGVSRWPSKSRRRRNR